MSYLIGIDPSFKGTGIAIYDRASRSIVKTQKVTSEFSYHDITKVHQASEVIVTQVIELISDFVSDNSSESDVHADAIIVEYPALATRSGAYLAILNGILYASLVKISPKIPIYWIPPIACDSFVHNKAHSKTFLVNWVRDRSFVNKRVTHDEATAIIFTQILESILSNSYKNSYFVE